MKILADATLPYIYAVFPPPFELKTYATYGELIDLLPDSDILVCRSTLKVSPKLLKKASLKCVATASSGSDHIDKAYLKENNILMIDAKGCNAKAVTDYVLACIASLQQQGLDTGKKAGIIGLGAVGTEVLKCLLQLGFEVVTYDPVRKPDSTFQSCKLKDLANCDLLCIHADLHDTQPYPSRKLINVKLLSNLKRKVIIINAARGEIVNEKAMLHSSVIYCTDVYQNEPMINRDIVRYAHICTPHIAGHSIEAKRIAVMLVSEKIHRWMGLSPPFSPRLHYEPLNFGPSWQEKMLAHYNPLKETQILKDADGRGEVFLSLRKAHNFRCHFEDEP